MLARTGGIHFQNVHRNRHIIAA